MNPLRIISPLLILIPLLTPDTAQSINCCCFGKSKKNKGPEDAYRASPEGATGATSTDEAYSEKHEESGSAEILKPIYDGSGETDDVASTPDGSSKPVKNPEEGTEGDSCLWSPTGLVSDQGIGNYCPGDCSLCNPENKGKGNEEGTGETNTLGAADKPEDEWS